MCEFLYISKVTILLSKTIYFDSERYMINILLRKEHKLGLFKVNWDGKPWDTQAEY